jgi:glyoxylase-like metal-dependent hydrolase (beta-lactamase superfamily II)
MKVVPIPNGVFAENCYLVVDEPARQCAVVDPGEEAGLILHKIEESGATLVGIWLTHAHLDHVVGVGRLAEETGVPIWLHPADRALYDAAAGRSVRTGAAAGLAGARPRHDAWRVARRRRSALRNSPRARPFAGQRVPGRARDRVRG